MKSEDASWQRLLAAVRRAPAEPDVPAPYGFAARVARLALAGEPRQSSFLELVSLRLSLRALGAAALLAAVALGVSFPTMVKIFSDAAPMAVSAQAAPAVNSAGAPASAEPASEAPASSEDPVAEMVGLV